MRLDVKHILGDCWPCGGMYSTDGFRFEDYINSVVDARPAAAL